MDFENISNQIKEFDKYLSRFGMEVSIVKKRNPRKIIPAGAGDREKFGRTRAKEYREKTGLTIMQLAKAMEVDRNIVSRMEDDSRTHLRISIQKYADYFGVPFEEMLATDDQPDETE